MRVEKIDTAEIILALSPQDCLLLARACMAARQCSSGIVPEVAWSPTAAQVFETMAAAFDLARANVQLRQGLAAGDPPEEVL